jgi:hypothetical protein
MLFAVSHLSMLPVRLHPAGTAGNVWHPQVLSVDHEPLA